MHLEWHLRSCRWLQPDLRRVHDGEPELAMCRTMRRINLDCLAEHPQRGLDGRWVWPGRGGGSIRTCKSLDAASLLEIACTSAGAVGSWSRAPVRSWSGPVLRGAAGTQGWVHRNVNTLLTPTT